MLCGLNAADCQTAVPVAKAAGREWPTLARVSRRDRCEDSLACANEPGVSFLVVEGKVFLASLLHSGNNLGRKDFGKPLARTEGGSDNVSAILESSDEGQSDDVFGRAIRAPKDLVSSQGSVGCHSRELVIRTCRDTSYVRSCD